MNKCLITKLNGSCNNANLLRIGEMRVHFAKVDSPTASTQGKAFCFDKDAELEIIGDAYFTDQNLSANLGKKITVPANNEAGFFVSNANCDVLILDKYSLTKVQEWVAYMAAYSKNISFTLEDLKYSAALNSISMSDAIITGDIANLKDLTSLTKLRLPKTQVSGDIANLKNLTSLTTLDLNGTSITGDIAQLESCPNIGYFRATNNVTGDLAKLPAKCYFVSLKGDNTTTYTWTSRSSSSNIFAVEGNITVTNIDKMLQDLAQCQAAIPASGENWFKTISLIGTRTSASDAAVQTLQSKGYTVSITPA